jgi:hypothetical protein
MTTLGSTAETASNSPLQGQEMTQERPPASPLEVNAQPIQTTHTDYFARKERINQGTFVSPAKKF